LAIVAFASIFAAVFLSIAAYVWLASRYGETIAAPCVGRFYVLLTAAAVGRCVVLRRRTKARALAKLKAAEQQAPWWSDPGVLAIGYEVAKIVGWRKLTPLVAAGVLAATLGRKSDKSDKPRPHSRPSSGNHHAD